MAASRFQAVNIRPGQAAFWEALARGALTLPPMEGNPLTYVGLSPVSALGWLIYPLRFNLLWVAATIGLASALGLWLASVGVRALVRSYPDSIPRTSELTMNLPVALAASKSYAERLFRYVVVDRLPREMADRALLRPAAEEGADYDPEALDELYRLTDGYPYFVQAYGKVTWDAAVTSPIQVSDVSEAAPEAERELAVGFFGARYDRATPAERDYMRVMAELGEVDDSANGSGHRDKPVSTAEIAASLGRKPQSLSPARDGLIKKGLVYSSERGTVAFTVPHFGKFLRAQRS